MYKFLIILLLTAIITGCGPAFVVASVLLSGSNEDRCMTLESKLLRQGLSPVEVRHQLIRDNCRNYVKQYVKN